MIGPKGTNEFGGIIERDVYKIRNLPPDDFDYIFDLGANIGMFSVYARMLFPKVKIFAIEADYSIFNDLLDNTRMLSIIQWNLTIGDGSTLCFGKRGHPLDNLIVPPDWDNDKFINMRNTNTLHNIFTESKCKISDSYMLKINCEGAEKYFIGDIKAEDILKNAKQIGMMIHFKSKLTPFSHWLEYKDYNNWFRNLMQDTHIIDYYASDRRKGRGIFYARKI
jgi:FkbM family methyltransferase